MISDNLKKLNITLPKAPDPVGAYVAYKRSNNLLFISGQLPINNDGNIIKGKLGKELTLEDGKKALSEGADILGTTLSGYAYQKAKSLAPPDLNLVKQFSELKTFTMAEGRYHSPKLAKNAIKAGANSVTVGSAITRIEHMTNWFKEAIESSGR